MQNNSPNEVNNMLTSILEALNIPENWIDPFIVAIDVVSIIIIIVLLDWLAKRFILTTVDKLIRKSKVTWDDIFLENKVFHNVAHIVPIISIDYLTPLFFSKFTGFIAIIDKATDLAFVWIIVLVLTSVISSLTQLSRRKEKYVSIAIQSLSQLAKIVIFLFAIIVTLSILLKIDLSAIFGTLGALTAVIILVFRDTILGFVASIQMTTSKMVKIGDWVAMPSYNADGPLIELNLMTAKVQNWDKTITSIPTYALISSSVKNWEGMSEAGVRRIKRSMNFDVNSIRFIDNSDLDKFKKFYLLKDYLEKKETEIETYNKSESVSSDIGVNGRRQTNIGVFRKYAELYLIHHEMISKEQTLMVRQLQASENGLPLEIYCFSTDTAWVNYEGIQSDIFDHLYATANVFGLKLFQNPSGNDLLSLKNN
jgi:miniconductance mechanosensitive channel